MSKTEETPAPKHRFPLLMVLLAALLLGGGGFAVTYLGLADGLIGGAAKVAKEQVGPEPRFLELEPLMIAVGGEGSRRQLRFRAFLELSEEAGHVAALQPRLLDVLATYLRAVDVAELEDPRALLRLRAQMLRRAQIVAGEDAVRDLLIVDFVIT
jgi:flagellar FliL protein